MKILQVHKDFQVRGGASRYFFEVSRLLHEQGHQVAFFSTLREGNEPTPWSRYFIPYRSFANINYLEAPRLFFHMIYSRQARKNFAQLLDDFHPDIVHLHSIYHQLSPSILYETQKRHIPVVQTIHDFHLIAPSHTLFHDGKICEITRKKAYYRALSHRCVKHSYLASFADAVEHYIHDASGIYQKGVNVFIASSRFYKNKMVAYGIPGEKIQVIPNFSVVGLDKKNPIGGYILYFGRLAEEKGLDTLLAAAAQLPHIPFKIAGDGPMREKLQAYTRKNNLHHIRFTGYKKGADLKRLLQNCRFIVLPTVCYENCPLSVFEAFAAGKPVVASRIGGIPELVKHNKNGLLFSPGNITDCSSAIDKLWTDTGLAKAAGAAAYHDATTTFSADKHYRTLMRLYRSLVA